MKPASSAPLPHLPAAIGISLPLRFIATGLVSLMVGVVWLAFRPEVLATYHYNQYVIALTHVFTLGWITSVMASRAVSA